MNPRPTDYESVALPLSYAGNLVKTLNKSKKQPIYKTVRHGFKFVKDFRMQTPLINQIKNMTHNGRILVIDDDLTSASILEDMLKEDGYETLSALKGSDAIAIMEDFSPSVILLDLVMPEMDGIDVCRKIREMNLPARPSIIVVSIKNEKDVIADTLCCGADDFLAKPVNKTELLARIKAQMRINSFYRELEEDKRNLETLLSITNSISASLDPNEVLDNIVHKVAEVVGAERCSIVLISKEDDGYILVTNDNPSMREFKLNLARYPEIKRVVETKRPLAIDDIQNHPILSSVKDALKDLKDLSLLIVPIVFYDNVLGTLFLRARRRLTGFSQKEIDFCRIVANTSFHAIRNARLFEKVSLEKDQLRELAVRDHRTSLYNHNFFYSRLEEEFERSVRYETPLSLIMMDIDDFKHINDTYGHRMGDMVLRELAATIKNGVRKSDIVARYGGEEFSVILPHTVVDGAVDEAERLRRLVERQKYKGLENEKITMSVGVASYPNKHTSNSGDLVNHADDALYRAKWSGKNCVRCMDPD